KPSSVTLHHVSLLTTHTTVHHTLSLHDALPILQRFIAFDRVRQPLVRCPGPYLGLSVRDQPVTIKRATWGGVSALCEAGVVVVGNFASDVGRFLWRCAPPG